MTRQEVFQGICFLESNKRESPLGLGRLKINLDMKKIKKVTRRAFTEKQLDMLEQYHYLYKKLWRIGLSDDESEYYDSLAEKIRKFIVIY